MKSVVMAILLPLLFSSSLAGQGLAFVPSSSPFEASVDKPLSLYHNVSVTTADGTPGELGDSKFFEVDLPAFEDEESGLSVLSAETTWNFPAGFAGGRRLIQTVVFGPSPAKGTTLEVPMTITRADGVVMEQIVQILVRSGAPDGGAAELCIQPGDGDELPFGPSLGDSIRPGWEVFADSRPMLAVGSAQFRNAPAATIENSTEFEIVEVLDDGSTGEAPFSIDQIHKRVLDGDADGSAEAVHFALRLSRDGAIAMEPDAVRIFELRAIRTDVLPTPLAPLIQFELTRRESVSHGSYATLGDPDEIASVTFERKQSKALEVRPVLYRNGNQLPAPAQATATVSPFSRNGDIEWTGLFNLAWTVEVDFPRLAALGGFVLGDTLTIELRFPGGGVAPLSGDLEVLQVGVNATVFKDLDTLGAKEYDVGEDTVTERDHVEALVQALCDAGLVIGADGKLSFPGLFEDEADDPDWPEIRAKLNAIRTAILAYKNAPRVKDGMNCLDGQSEWKVTVSLEKEGRQVPVVIVLGTDDKEVEAKDNKSGDGSLVIAIGKCGSNASGGNAGKNGAGAKVELKKDGSLGIAAGGNGGQGGDLPESPSGGSGASAEVEADGRGSTGISLGGNGGNTNGTNEEGGNGGNADSTAGKRSSVISEAGSAGSQRLPSDDTETETGSSSVTNPDSVPDYKGSSKVKTRTAGPGRLAGRGGSARGGITRAKPDVSMDDTSAKVRLGDPITGED